MTHHRYDLGRSVYTIDYVVREGDRDVKGGEIPFTCTLVDPGGNTCSAWSGYMQDKLPVKTVSSSLGGDAMEGDAGDSALGSTKSLLPVEKGATWKERGEIEWREIEIDRVKDNKRDEKKTKRLQDRKTAERD